MRQANTRTACITLTLLGLAIPSLAQRATCNGWSADLGSGGGGYTNMYASALCPNLTNWWKFEEGNDSLRKDSLGYADLRECPGTSAPNVAGKFGNAYQGSGTSALYLPYGSQWGGANKWTIAFWFYATSNSGQQGIVLTYNQQAIAGLTIGLFTSGSFRMYAGINEMETGTAYQALSGAVSLNVWHLAVITSSPSLVGTKRIGISLNAGNFTYVNYTYDARPHSWDLFIGGAGSGTCASTAVFPFTGRLDSLGFWHGRALAKTDAAILYNAGAGRDFPF